jgi:hypothetical protein
MVIAFRGVVVVTWQHVEHENGNLMARNVELPNMGI